MLERILPASAAVVATRGDRTDEVLFAEEEVAIGRAVEKRRREFTTARACARTALAQLGFPPQAIASDPRGAPQWPPGVVGSITHCDGYRGCAVAHSADLLAIGVDAERNEPLPDGLLGDIALPEERAMLRTLAEEGSEIHWDRLLFSAKESVYKAWYPLAGKWLGFEDAIVVIDPSTQTYLARLLVPGPTVAGRELSGFAGRWIAGDGLIFTAIAMDADVASGGR
ncbi:MAG TPA: 4'-phosphopantetheinyl transferase superfamily protein [Solirubrobacterales bacterium]|nr:4'-phosphopantetheinyl transferase superfamily protein [Solirubrobacterales bacterium]